MSEFFEYVLWQLQNSLVLVLLACIAAAAAIGATYCLHRRKYKGEKKFPWGRSVLWLMLLGYLVIVLYATVLRGSGGYRDWNVYLFRAWREAWNNFSARNWGNVLLNIAMFVPLGFLLPLLGKKFRRWYVTIPAGFGVSLAIELTQLALKKGICDVDDLFCNGLGAMTGFFAVMALLSLFGKTGRRLKPVLGYLGLMLVPVAAIGGIFAVYHFQEYGNFPDAAAYRVSLEHLDWSVACDLPDSAGEVPVYRARAMSKADCDAVAERMAGLIGAEVDMVSYYQEMAYYNLTNGVVKVNYYDGGYEFRVFHLPFEVGAEPDRGDVEKALEPYAIAVPESAVFAAEEDGWYSFTCDQVVDGDLMLDGTLRVRHEVTEVYAHLAIENYLIQYAHYKDVEILSPAEAYQKVLRGDFKYAAALKYDAEGTAILESCTLDYTIDTKGFYQPVYCFEITLPGKDYHYTAMIPARK